jgi:catalase
VNAEEVKWLRRAVQKAKATAWLVGPRRGTVYGAQQTAGHDAELDAEQTAGDDADAELEADHHFEGARSTLFDALLVPSGLAHAQTLANNGRAVHWVREAFGHLKPIGAIGEGAWLAALDARALLVGIKRYATNCSL